MTALTWRRLFAFARRTTHMAYVVRTLRDSFTPLRLPNLRIYLIGQAISLLGTWMQVTAQGWLVWELSHSEVALGIVSMLGSLPLLLFGLWAGVWADRLDRRKILIGTQVAAMILALILAALVWTQTVQLWQVYMLSFLFGCVGALDFPAQQAFLGDLSGMTSVRKVIVLNAMIFQIGRLIGPALAGFVVGAIGAAMAFFLNGLSFVAVIISLLLVRSPPRSTPHALRARSGGRCSRRRSAWRRRWRSAYGTGQGRGGRDPGPLPSRGAGGKPRPERRRRSGWPCCPSAT